MELGIFEVLNKFVFNLTMTKMHVISSGELVSKLNMPWDIRILCHILCNIGLQCDSALYPQLRVAPDRPVLEVSPVHSIAIEM